MFLAVAMGKAVMQHKDFVDAELASRTVGPDARRQALLGKAMKLAAAMEAKKANLVIGADFRRKHARQVEDIEWCCSQPNSKWKVIDVQAGGQTVGETHTLEDVDALAALAKAARRLQQRRGLRGRFFDHPLAWAAK